MHSDMLSQDPMAVLINRRETIEAVMAQYLAAGHKGRATDAEKSASVQLFDVVLAGLNGEAAPSRFGHMAFRRHVGRFGDGLTPILKDVLPPDVSDAFIARCVDRYWATLQAAAA